ncbi:19394_t:CDS:2 [Entrophospora sp. SA101]|nr:6602_t:CDS:2 [Entrophospora sp. SA101]CAJ0753788.1 19394_t:CDS:2 [Entrophospora sp. SA101]CAJ0827429.1 15420_t:CDS:2 [Entrophospora sp. SA101]CAJ0844400.1 15292_t:CDS:2 [Entrophospora sp. SA101]CAJ0863616.1 12280_t:CDS:2 [Entrophospora sp. SA101]
MKTKFWSAKCLLGEKTIQGRLKYLVKWGGKNRNGEVWEPTWEPPCNISNDLIMEWNSKKHSMKNFGNSEKNRKLRRRLSASTISDDELDTREIKRRNVVKASSVEDNIDSSKMETSTNDDSDDGALTCNSYLPSTPLLISECESILNDKSAEFQPNQTFLKKFHELVSNIEDDNKIYANYKQAIAVKHQQRKDYGKIFDDCKNLIEYLKSSNDTLNKEKNVINAKLEKEIKKGDSNVELSMIKLESLQEEYNSDCDEIILDNEETPSKNLEKQSKAKLKEIYNLRKVINDLKEDRDGYIKTIDSFRDITSPNSDSKFSSDEHAELISSKILYAMLEQNIKLENESIKQL